ASSPRKRGEESSSKPLQPPLHRLQKPPPALRRGRIHQVVRQIERSAAPPAQRTDAAHDRLAPWLADDDAPPPGRAAGRHHGDLADMAHQRLDGPARAVEREDDVLGPYPVEPA